MVIIDIDNIDWLFSAKQRKKKEEMVKKERNKKKEVSNKVSVCVHEWAKKLERKLGLIHTRHFDIQYCDKKIFLSHGFLLAKVSSWRINKPRCIKNINQGIFLTSLPWLFNRNQCLKNVFLIFLSQYCVSKCLVWIRP